jgi:hypothetical protein
MRARCLFGQIAGLRQLGLRRGTPRARACSRIAACGWWPPGGVARALAALLHDVLTAVRLGRKVGPVALRWGHAEGHLRSGRAAALFPPLVGQHA